MEFFNRIGQLQTVALNPRFTGKEAFAWGSEDAAANAPSTNRSSPDVRRTLFQEPAHAGRLRAEPVILGIVEGEHPTL